MSHVKELSLWGKINASRTSLRSFAYHFFRDLMAGQKLFLFHDDLPRVINISPIDFTCMYACRMCPFHEQDTRDLYAERREMSFETLQAIVASVPNDPHYSFDISAFGETLLFKRLPEFIAYMKKEKPRVNTVVSTNALPLTETMFRGLVEAGLDNLQLSLYAQNREDYARITASRPENFDKVRDNVRNAARIRQELGSKHPFMQAFIFATQETDATIPAFLEEWSSYVDKAFVRHVYTAGRTIEGMTPTRHKSLPEPRYPCVQPWYSTGIDANGDVHVCRMFQWYKDSKDVILGNIKDRSLRELWQTPLFKEFRAKHLAMDLDGYSVCTGCDSWANYTNVFDRQNDGSYRYAGIRLRDFFRTAKDYRGG